MTSHPPGSSSDGRRVGFSLLELIIVLVVLSLLMAITWPSLRRPLAKGLVHEAARQLAKDLSRTRLMAIDSGSTLALRFEMDGTRYQVGPAEMVLAETDQSTAGLSDTMSGDLLGDDADTLTDGDDLAIDDTEPVPVQDNVGSTIQDDARARPLEATPWADQLPHEVVFGDPMEQQDDDDAFQELFGDQMDLDETESVETRLDQVKGELAGASWSEPVLFYPTGRSDQAEFLLRCPDGYTVLVTLRGLTGAVTIGPVQMPRDELERLLDPDQYESDGMESERIELEGAETGGDFAEPTGSSEVSRGFN